jgi:hypothetical protein
MLYTHSITVAVAARQLEDVFVNGDPINLFSIKTSRKLFIGRIV